MGNGVAHSGLGPPTSTIKTIPAGTPNLNNFSGKTLPRLTLLVLFLLLLLLFCFVLDGGGCGLVWFGLVWFGLVWFGLVWFGFSRLGVALACPGTHSVDQAGLELRNPPASASSAEITGLYHHTWLQFIM